MTGLVTPPAHLRRVTLEEPEAFLVWLSTVMGGALRLDDFELLHPWAIVALAALGRKKSSGEHIDTSLSAGSSAAKFAHAIGFEDVVEGKDSGLAHQPRRTVRMQSVAYPNFPQIDGVARNTSDLVVRSSAEDAAAKTIFHVVVELLRNAVQHSRDPLGGVVVAQRMDAGEKRIQVAVADNGIGIQSALLAKHPTLSDPRTALEKAIQPHISGTFEEGLTGTSGNAGLGLFFVAEMAKLTAGTMLVASRGASLFLRGDREDPTNHQLSFLGGGAQYPGTLVVFEAPVASVHVYGPMIEVINQRAKDRMPGRALHKWLLFQKPPSGTSEILVAVASENTAEAQAYAQKKLVPHLARKQAIALNFRNFEIVTQSFIHALLYEAIRVAWALKTPIYIVDAQPAVRSTLEFLETYALAG